MIGYLGLFPHRFYESKKFTFFTIPLYFHLIIYLYLKHHYHYYYFHLKQHYHYYYSRHHNYNHLHYNHVVTFITTPPLLSSLPQPRYCHHAQWSMPNTNIPQLPQLLQHYFDTIITIDPPVYHCHQWHTAYIILKNLNKSKSK